MQNLPRHPHRAAATRTLTDPNDLAFRLALLNPVVDLKLGDTILVTEKDEPLWNITRAGRWELPTGRKSHRAGFPFQARQGQRLHPERRRPDLRLLPHLPLGTTVEQCQTYPAAIF